MSGRKQDDAESISNEGEAGLQPPQTGANSDGSSTSSTTRSMSRQPTSSIVAGHLRSSNNMPSVPTDNNTSSAGAATPKRNRMPRISYSPTVEMSKKKNSPEDEEEKPSTSRQTRSKRTTSTALVSTPGKMSKNELNDWAKKLLAESLKRTRSSSAGAKGEKRKRGDSSSVLVRALTEAILVTPYLVDVKLGLDGTSPIKNNEVPIVPLNVIKSENLPGIHIWTENNYKNSGLAKKSEVKKSGNSEFFAGREIDRIVGFVLHKPTAFILVKLSMERNEKTIDVMDAVQAVDSALAGILFPKAFSDYMSRMALNQKQSTDADPEDGPSGTWSAKSPSGRPRRGNKD